MVKVTRRAQEKLIELLDKRVPKYPNVFLRIDYSMGKPDTLALVYGREREHDHIAVTDKDGDKVLLIDPVVATDIDGMEIDYDESKNQAGFTLKNVT
ncbi:MAG: hypothetical protein ACMUJM_22745 [bacterium]